MSGVLLPHEKCMPPGVRLTRSVGGNMGHRAQPRGILTRLPKDPIRGDPPVKTSTATGHCYRNAINSVLFPARDDPPMSTRMKGPHEARNSWGPNDSVAVQCLE